MAGGYVVITAIGDGSHLVVLADRACDLGQVAYETVMLINRAGAALTPVARMPQHA